VSTAGQIIPLAGAGDAAVYEFQPTRVQCGDDGVTQWQPDASARDRYIFHVRDPKRYGAAMTAALKTLVTAIG
jgi:hypothetical protein